MEGTPCTGPSRQSLSPSTLVCVWGCVCGGVLCLPGEWETFLDVGDGTRLIMGCGREEVKAGKGMGVGDWGKNKHGRRWEDAWLWVAPAAGAPLLEHRHRVAAPG